MPDSLGLPVLSPKSSIEKKEIPYPDSPVNAPLPSMQQRPNTKACNRENKKNGLLEWVNNRPMTNDASNRLKRHRSFKSSMPVTSDPEPHQLQVFHCAMSRLPSSENLSVTTDTTLTSFDSPSMLSIHSVESDALDWSRPHGAGHLTASPPFVPSSQPATLQHFQPHHHHRTQPSLSRLPPSLADQHLPSITQKVDKQGRMKKWHSERIKRRPLMM